MGHDLKERVPPRQHSYAAAAEIAMEAVRNQPGEQLEWLGAKRLRQLWQVPVLNGLFEVDLRAGTISLAGGGEPGGAWKVLVLHYLKTTARPLCSPPEIAFANMPGGLVYASVYQNRVIARLCATAGRELPQLRLRAESIGAIPCEGGDAAFDICVFPRIMIRLIWHGPDEEFSSTATILLPRCIETFFSVEDVVVMSECFVARMSGKPF